MIFLNEQEGDINFLMESDEVLLESLMLLQEGLWSDIKDLFKSDNLWEKSWKEVSSVINEKDDNKRAERWLGILSKFRKLEDKAGKKAMILGLLLVGFMILTVVLATSNLSAIYAIISGIITLVAFFGTVKQSSESSAMETTVLNRFPTVMASFNKTMRRVKDDTVIEKLEELKQKLKDKKKSEELNQVYNAAYSGAAAGAASTNSIR